MSGQSLLSFSSEVSIRDRQRRIVLPFDVPVEGGRLNIDLTYGPDANGGIPNLVTLGLRDPHGLRGNAHRRQTPQAIVVGPDSSTPGFVNGPIDAGDWVCVIDLHEVLNPASSPCSIRVDIAAEVGETSAEVPSDFTRRDAPGSLNPRPGWYRGDLHAHTIHSDGADTVHEMAVAARAKRLDFLAVTDHNTTSHMYDDSRWPAGVLPIRGMELTTFHGHANVLGTSERIDWDFSDGAGLDGVVERVHQQGGLVVANHPRALGNPSCTGCRWDLAAPLHRLDAIEVWNGPWSNGESRNPDALELWTRLVAAGSRVPAVAGGDAHSQSEMGERGLPVTVVHASALSENSILRGLAEGKSYLSTGPDIRHVLGDDHTERELLPGANVDDLRGQPLTTMIGGIEEEATLRLISDGRVHESWLLGPGETEITSNVPNPSVWSHWELRRGRSPGGDLILLSNPWYAHG